MFTFVFCIFLTLMKLTSQTPSPPKPTVTLSLIARPMQSLQPDLGGLELAVEKT